MTDKNNNTEKNMEIAQKRARKDILLDYAPYIVIIVVVILLRTFIATPIRVNGASMDPTINNGETMVLNKLSMHMRGLRRWDIVVARADDTHLIKRVIALPGETVKYYDGVLFINGEPVEDKFSLTTTYDFTEITVGENEYFLMGDNRAVSQDSRNPIIGNVSRKDILGKTNIILFPFSRFGMVE